ncbi:TetR/AcrR family transcriptional regulator [Phenylobacterium sp.]|uniref:TetR/AcrR family transcriptional regulator n=1 Tax=Phenylobacterium sp. TaxID=1871053 RepID=UPI002E36CFA7|nr:TetR/AcrR family transcriptional regulator [Phenylobacterium sp.]HEX2560872.1 TetR/AcrR family transcriptional regulator [Phenylobacterium sp.]
MGGDAGAKSAKARPRYEARREAILTAAAEALAQEGLAGFTLASVAKRMDLHPVSLTYYFKRKEELVSACLLHGADRFDAMLDEAQGAGAPPERLAAFVRAYFEVQRRIALGEEPPLAPLDEVRTLWRASGDPVDLRYQEVRQRIADLLVGEDRPAPAAWRQRLLSRLILQQLASSDSWLADYALADYPRVAERVAEVMIFGLAAPGQRWPQDLVLTAPESTDSEMVRERFLIEATDLINREGWTGASVDRISARLKVTKGSFYHHHADKDELIGACFDRSFAILESALARARTAETGWRRLFLATAPLAVSQAHDGRGRILRRYALRLARPELRGAVEQRMRQTASALAGLICDGVSDGTLRPVDPTIAAHMLLAMINSALMLDRVPELTPEITLYGYVRPAIRGVFSVR